MKNIGPRTFWEGAFFIFMSLIISSLPPAFAADFGEVERILGAAGQMQEDVFVVRFPRSDLQIKIEGESVPTALGFGSWVAWKDMGANRMVMGDLVLLEKEANAVLSALIDGHIRVTALHNHFLHEEPRIMFMHIHGMGETSPLARGIRKALDQTSTPQPRPPAGSMLQPVLSLDVKRIEEIIGHAGQTAGGVFRITIGRPGVKIDGVELSSSIGLNTWAAFAGTNDKAIVAGDVAMTAKEVNEVVRALRRGGIEVVAIHNHMLDEEPRIFFLHYWGKGPVEKLAQTLRAAFDRAKGPAK